MNTRAASLTLLFVSCATIGGWVSSAVAQTPPANSGCNASGTAEAATQPNRQAADGTSPGNIGSTGWTGGTGGAHMGTNPQGALPSSPTWQPETVRGLDLAMAAPKPASAGQGC